MVSTKQLLGISGLMQCIAGIVYGLDFGSAPLAIGILVTYVAAERLNT